MGKKTRRTATHVAAAAGLALSVGAANAVVIDGPEGIGKDVWNDSNMNGVQDAGEPGLAGVTVNLLSDDGASVLDTTVTDVLGEYWFQVVGTGSGGLDEDFIVEFVLPAGFVFSPQDSGGDDALDSDADVLTGRTGLVNITDFVKDLTVDAGMYEVGSAVPEPGGLLLFGAGLAALGYRVNRRTKCS